MNNIAGDRTVLRPVAAGVRRPLAVTTLLVVLVLGVEVHAQTALERQVGERKAAATAPTRALPLLAQAPRATTSLTMTPVDSGMASVIAPAMDLVVGKSTLLRLPGPIERISLGNPAVADVTLISPSELYLLGKTFGSTNVIMWRRGGPTTIFDVTVSADVTGLRDRLKSVMPEEQGIQIQASSDSIVLSGTVSSALKADHVVQIAESFVRVASRGITLPIAIGAQTAQPGQQLSVGQEVSSGGSASLRPRVVNLMRVAQPQQVMLEVKVAEVSKNLLDKLGVGLDLQRRSGSVTYGIISSLLANGPGAVFGVNSNGNALQIDAERKDGLVKILAEPNIVAVSGQEASFLAGGKIFIPVSRTNNAGIAVFTLEEKEFGVGLKFTPTVLDGGRINLKVAPEVSELAQTGSPFLTLGGVTAVLPSFTTRRAQTTVQLMDGQSLAIAGLIKNNVTESIKRLPILGEIPILGALFRSSEFQTDRSELMFIVTPRLVRPLAPGYALPTDGFVPPTRSEFFLEGKLEGSGSPDVPPDRGAPAGAGAAAPARERGGFQIK